MNRCSWSEDSEKLQNYHDEIWGREEKDEKRVFRMLILEIFQSGLSWHTILQKEKYFDEAFDNFDIEKISKYDEKKIDELLENTNIIRNRQKIEATIHNAKLIKKMNDEGKSFSQLIWSYVFDTPIINPWSHEKEVPDNNYLSDKITHDLKEMGFKFIGSTVIYSFLQAIGVINDHITSCDFKYED